MKKTLQDQYLLIKEGKGHVGVFLTEAKRQFPNIVRNAATLDETVASLKSKNIISENVFSVMPEIMGRPKKESYETAFEAFLAEAKKKNEDEKVKAEEKKVSKPVEEDLSHNYNNSDEKNPDNMIFDQIMTGYYAEMKDPKNADKTMQQLKDIVFKNLEKDPIYYTKNGQFGVKDLGYVTEAPGLGEPKEPKGKYKSSGYGDLKESKETEDDIKSKLVQMGVSPIIVNKIAGDKGIEGLKDRLIKKLEGGEVEYYDGDDEEEVKDVLDMSWTKGFTKEEQTLREVIREMIDAELEEAYQLVNQGINSISQNLEENTFKKGDKVTYLGNPAEITFVGKDQMDRVYYSVSYDKGNGKTKASNLYNKGDEIEPIKEGNHNAEDFKPYVVKDRNNPNYVKADLREGVEKDLADINKEAEHEVLQAKLDKIDALIDHRRSKLSKLDEDEDMKALTDKKKVKELEKDIKKLEVARKKIEKMMSKFKGKKAESKEVIDEDETPLEASEEYKRYQKNAERRYDEEEDIDSIIDTYTNISQDMKDKLRDDLEGKMDGMDF